MEIIIIFIEIVFALLGIILFFKVWGMTNDVRAIMNAMHYVGDPVFPFARNFWQKLIADALGNRVKNFKSCSLSYSSQDKKIITLNDDGGYDGSAGVVIVTTDGEQHAVKIDFSINYDGDYRRLKNWHVEAMSIDGKNAMTEKHSTKESVFHPES